MVYNDENMLEVEPTFECFKHQKVHTHQLQRLYSDYTHKRCAFVGWSLPADTSYFILIDIS